MLHALYAHLWSIADRGLPGFVADLQGAGLNAVSYAATYHAVRQLMPANPRRHVMLVPRSHAYFSPRGSYGRLAPAPSPLLAPGRDLEAVQRALAKGGLATKAWVIGCHNSELGALCPDLAIRNALGDALGHHLCPAQPEVVEYLCALVGDIAGHHELAAVELESFSYPERFEHGAHHEMSGLPSDPFHSQLLSFCCCPACGKALKAGGVNADDLTAAIRRELLTWLQTPAWQLTPQRAASAQAAFEAATPAFPRAEAIRHGQVLELGRAVRQALAVASPGTRLIDLGSGQATARADLLSWADGLVTPGRPEAVLAARQSLGPSAWVGAGIYPLAPGPLEPQALAAAVAGCARAGCDGFNYYNHALMQQSTWQDIAAAIAALP